jgi:hypothetical protein
MLLIISDVENFQIKNNVFENNFAHLDGGCLNLQYFKDLIINNT